MTIDFVGWQEVVYPPSWAQGWAQSGGNPPTGVGEERVAAEGQIISEGPCVDKLSLSWAGEVESELDDEEADKNGVVLVSRCI